MQDWYNMLEQYEWWGNTAQDYTVALGVFFGLLIVLKVFKLFVLAQVRRWAKKTAIEIDDAVVDYIDTIHKVFYVLVSFFIATRFLILPGIIYKAVYVAFLLIVIYEVIRAVESLATFAIENHAQKHPKKFDKVQNKIMLHLSKLGIRVMLWVVGIILVMSNMGLNVTSLVAGMGIGGIAIALALQNILGDIFSSFSIFLDRPFEVGDFIVVGEHSGTVKRVGLKTTRLKTLLGEELVISNNELTRARIQNFKKLERRREEFTFGVTYETSADKLERIPEMIKEIVEGVEGVDFNRCHFSAYADSSLNFETVYHINDSSYEEYMDKKQVINLGMFKKFEAEGIDFAYPTQTVYMNKV